MINFVVSSGVLPTDPSPSCTEAQEVDAEIPLNTDGNVRQKEKPGKTENICKFSPFFMQTDCTASADHLSISGRGHRVLNPD